MPVVHTIQPWRIALLVLLVGSFVWLGSLHTRMLIGNTLLAPGTLEFSDTLAPEAEQELFRTLSGLAVAGIVGYVITLGGAIAFLFLSPLRMRADGWLLMSSVLFFLFMPVELFTMSIDIRMIRQEFFTTAGNDVFRTLFLERMGALAGVPIIAILCYYTIVVLAIFQPLTQLQSHEA